MSNIESNSIFKCNIFKKLPKQHTQLIMLPCKCSFICQSHLSDLISEKFNLKSKIKCKKCAKVFELTKMGFEFICA